MSFNVTINDEAEFPIVILAEEGISSAEIYAYGALLNRFSAMHHGDMFNVIDGFENIEDAKANMTPPFKSAKLSPFVCRIKNARYRFGETDHKLTKYVVNNAALHGLVFDQVFSVVDTTATDEYAKVLLQFVYDNAAEGYPFAYRCEVEYCLKKDSTLCIKTTITNIDDQLIPIADGWHPYFTLQAPIDECQLEFQSHEKLEFNAALLPTGKKEPYQEFGSIKQLNDTWFDNCFTLDMDECQPLAVFRNPAKNIQVEIHPGKAYPYLQIFTPPHRNSIAIENLSAPPDALNSFEGLHVLEPKESVSFATKYIIKSL